MSRVYDKYKRDEHKRNQFITETLPEYFGVMAVQKQRSMMKGRHPNSMKKDDELWHYSRISSERHRLVKSGKALWEVVESSAKKLEEIPDVSSKKTDPEEEEIIKGILEQRNRTPTKPNTSLPDVTPSIKAKSGGSKVSFAPNKSLAESSISTNNTGNHLTSPTPHTEEKSNSPPKLKVASSLQAQLKTAMSNPSNDLNLKVDFLNRSLVHFNMTFMIMNYNNEVIYIDSDNLLRVKHISKIQPNDRVRWKMVDLINPSNPGTIGFGDNLWLQAVDNPDTVIDATFQTGSVITTKLFTPTDVKGYTFEPLTQPLETNTHTAGTNYSKLTKHRTSVTMRPTHGKFHLSHGQSLLSLETSNTSALANGESNASLFEDEDELSGHSEEEDDDGKNSPAFRNMKKRKDSINDNQTINRHNEEYKKRIKICGHVSASRIVDVKKIEQLPDTTILSDEKATRYVSRLATHLGKFSIETAVRMSDPSKIQKYFYSDLTIRTREKKRDKRENLDDNNNDDETTDKKDENNNDPLPDNSYDPVGSLTDNIQDLAFEMMLNKMVRNADSNWLKDYIKTHILSLTPIIIQQDQYCLSTATYHEYKQWPLDSSNILQISNKFSQEQRNEYEEQYEKFLFTQNQFSLLDSSVNIHSESMMKKFQRKKERDRLLASHNSNKDSYSSTTHEKHASSRPTTPGESNTKASAANNQSTNMDGFCCLRRVVRRNPPYDFLVDQRCVWKICLYEQFSDNAVQSEREKEVKKSMETATMVLKLSKMNREGARTHIMANTKDNLPSLVSGENFPKRLREITFQLQQKKNEKFLSQRRVKEQYFEDYFNKRINHLLEKEEGGFKSSNSHQHNDYYDPNQSQSTNYFSLMKMDGSVYSPLFATNESHQYDSEYFQNQDDEELSFTQFSTLSDDNNMNISTIKKVRAQSALFGKMTRQSSTLSNKRSSVATANNPSLEDVASLFLKRKASSPTPSSTPINRAKTTTPQSRRATELSKPNIPSDLNTFSFSPAHHRQSIANEGGSHLTEKNQDLPPRPQTSNAALAFTKKKEYSEDIKKVFNTGIVPPYQKKLLLVNSNAVHEFDELSNGEQLLSYHKTLAHINRATKVRKFVLKLVMCV